VALTTVEFISSVTAVIFAITAKSSIDTTAITTLPLPIPTDRGWGGRGCSRGWSGGYSFLHSFLHCQYTSLVGYTGKLNQVDGKKGHTINSLLRITRGVEKQPRPLYCDTRCRYRTLAP